MFNRKDIGASGICLKCGAVIRRSHFEHCNRSLCRECGRESLPRVNRRCQVCEKKIPRGSFCTECGYKARHPNAGMGRGRPRREEPVLKCGKCGFAVFNNRSGMALLKAHIEQKHIKEVSVPIKCCFSEVGATGNYPLEK